MPIDTDRGQTIKNNVKNYLKTIKSLKKCVQMLKLFGSIALKLSTITQLREEVVVLRNNLEASQDTIIELARLYQNQTQLIYQLKFRLENAEKTIESITTGITNGLVTQITDDTKAAIPNYSYKKASKKD